MMPFDFIDEIMTISGSVTVAPKTILASKSGFRPFVVSVDFDAPVGVAFLIGGRLFAGDLFFRDDHEGIFVGNEGDSIVLARKDPGTLIFAVTCGFLRKGVGEGLSITTPTPT